MHAPTPAHKDLKGAVDKERNPAAFPRRYGQQDSDVTPAWEEPSGTEPPVTYSHPKSGIVMIHMTGGRTYGSIRMVLPMQE